MSQKIPLKILGLSTSQAQSGSFALVLGEINGNRRLPIIIGMAEAQAIAIEIEKIKPNRPLTHDLFKSLSDKFNIYIKEILIYGLKEGVFFSKIYFQSELGEEVEIESRPSDAVALALRFEAPIFVSESVISEAGIIIADEDAKEEVKEADKSESEGGLSTISNEELQRQLDDAISNEDYEKAAILRDELNKRN